MTDPSWLYSTYENQFGFIQRPTHRNTTWQRAQFEVCGHRYADVSEFGYGVALLNDSKYGHACEHSTLRLSLLRASTLPDDEQDQGAHHFSFAVLPHRGSFAEADVPAVARMFNFPLQLRRLPAASKAKQLSLLAGGHDGSGPFSVLGARNVILDTVKRGEEDCFSSHSAGGGAGGETVILRLYEAYGGSATAKIAATLPHGRKLESAELVDVSSRPGKLARAFRLTAVLLPLTDLGTQGAGPRHFEHESERLGRHLQGPSAPDAGVPGRHRQAHHRLKGLPTPCVPCPCVILTFVASRLRSVPYVPLECPLNKISAKTGSLPLSREISVVKRARAAFLSPASARHYGLRTQRYMSPRNRIGANER